MSYNIELTDNFKREAKRLTKKFPSLRAEIETLGEQLAENPMLGESLGKNVYKIRLSIASKNSGKAGGARIISFVKIIQQTVYLLSIYTKGERSTITDKEIQALMKDYL
jgi:mRNA-degrading endonuclease RelE of RelBE toxin-antitoxin system